MGLLNKSNKTQNIGWIDYAISPGADFKKLTQLIEEDVEKVEDDATNTFDISCGRGNRQMSYSMVHHRQIS